MLQQQLLLLLVGSSTNSPLLLHKESKRNALEGGKTLHYLLCLPMVDLNVPSMACKFGAFTLR